MKMNKKFRVMFILAVVALFTGVIYCTSVYNKVKEINVQCSYMKYSTFDELESNADLILIGKALDQFENREHIVTYFDEGSIQDFYTNTKFEIKNIIKKPEKLALTENCVFDIIEPVGLIQEVDSKKLLKLEGYEPLKENEIYVIYLKDNGLGRYGIINMNDGKFSPNEENYNNEVSKKLKSGVISKYKSKM